MQWSYFKMPPYQRLIIAALSGGLVGFLWATEFAFWVYGFFGQDNSDSWVFAAAVMYVIPGLIFSMTVMAPFLSSRSIHWFRILALIGVGSLSYGCAFETVGHLSPFSWPTDPSVTRSYLEIYSDGYAYEIAGLFGALIVGTGGVLFLRMKIQWRFVLSIIIAGVLGGIVFDLTDGGVWANLMSDSVISHAAWQTLVCAALCVAKIDTRQTD
jgi:hypothetical protein